MSSTEGPRWVKSSASYANGDCVEVAWVKSSASQSGNSAEVGALEDGMIGIRDSKDPDGPVLRFTTGEWNAFLAGVNRGEFFAHVLPRS
jgi:Domain of unknown function (DUF397)